MVFADLMYLVLIRVVDDLLLSLLDDIQHEGIPLFGTVHEICTKSAPPQNTAHLCCGAEHSIRVKQSFEQVV